MKKSLFLILGFLIANLLNAQEKREFILNFDSNSYEISKEKADLINSEIEEIRKTFYNHCRIAITGYTDNTGTLAFNKTLSLLRAKAITNYFISKGFSAKRITYKGENFKNPVGDNNSEEGKAKNRRVNILVTFDFNEINELKRFSDKPESISINSTLDSVYVSKSGTKIKIQANSFVDENGVDVDGNITLSYQEFRTPLDFILAGIPMDIEENGKRCFFNSTGMFRILAYKNDKPVFLKMNRSLEVEFKQNADLPSTNFYQLDTLTRKWNRISRITNELDWACWVNDDKEKPKCPLSSCSMLFYVRDKGLQYAKSEVSLFDLAHITNPGNFDKIQRKLKRDREKIASNENRISEFGPKLNKIETLYEIKILENDVDKVVLKVESVGDKAASNALLKKATWTCKTYKIDNNLLQKKWPVCTVEKTDLDYYILTFKDSVSQYKLDYVSINLNQKYRKKKADKIISKVLESTNSESEQMNNTINTYKNLKVDIVSMKAAADTLSFIKMGGLSDELNQDIVKSVQCFVQYNRGLMSAKEGTMSDDNWLKYFDSHKEAMITRYTEDIKNNAEYTKCVEAELARQKREETDEKVKNLVVPLSISSLGIYNCDIVARLQNPITIKAEYKTEDGKSIAPYFVYLVDDKFNGIIRYDFDQSEFTPARFPYNPNSKNLLIIFDEEGKAYLFSAEKFREMKISKDKVNTFIIERITSKNQLEKALL